MYMCGLVYMFTCKQVPILLCNAEKQVSLHVFVGRGGINTVILSFM